MEKGAGEITAGNLVENVLKYISYADDNLKNIISTKGEEYNTPFIVGAIEYLNNLSDRTGEQKKILLGLKTILKNRNKEQENSG